MITLGHRIVLLVSFVSLLFFQTQLSLTFFYWGRLALRCSIIILIKCSVHVSSVLSISIDNDIVGEPDIECLDEEIRIWVKTRKPFGGLFFHISQHSSGQLTAVVSGRIYAKGKAEVEECYKDDFARERTNKPHFDLKFGVCGMRSLRSVGLKRGCVLGKFYSPWCPSPEKCSEVSISLLLRFSDVLSFLLSYEWLWVITSYLVSEKIFFTTFFWDLRKLFK